MPPLPAASSSLTTLSSALPVPSSSTLSSVPPSTSAASLAAASAPSAHVQTPAQAPQEEKRKLPRELPRNVAQLATDAFEEQQFDVGVAFLDAMRSPLWMPSTSIIHALFFLSLRSIPHNELYPTGRAAAKAKVPLSLKVSYTPPTPSAILAASALLSALGATHGASTLLAHLPYCRTIRVPSPETGSRRKRQTSAGTGGDDESDEEMAALGSHVALASSIWALLRGADASLEVRKPSKGKKKAPPPVEDKDGAHPELEEGRWRTIGVLLPMWRAEREEKERAGELSITKSPIIVQQGGKGAQLGPKTHLARQFRGPFPSADVGEALDVAVRGLEYATAAARESASEDEQSLTALEHKSLYDRARTASELIGELFALGDVGQLDKVALSGGLVERLEKISVEGWIVLSETLSHTPQGQDLARLLRDSVGEDPAVHISGPPPQHDLPSAAFSQAASQRLGSQSGSSNLTPLSQQLDASALGLLEPSLDFAKALMSPEYQEQLNKPTPKEVAKELETYKPAWVLEGAMPRVQVRTTPWAVGEEENYLTLNLGKRGRKVPEAIVAQQVLDTSDAARKLRADRRIARDITCQLRAAQMEAKLRFAVIKWSVVRALRDDFEASDDEAAKELQKVGLERTLREITASIIRATKECELCIAEMEEDPVARRITGAPPKGSSQDKPSEMRPAMVDAISKAKRFCAALHGIADAAKVLVALPLETESADADEEEEEDFPPASQPLSIPAASQEPSQPAAAPLSDAMIRLAQEQHLRLQSSASAMEVDEALPADALELQRTMNAVLQAPSSSAAVATDALEPSSAPSSAVEISQVLRRTTPIPFATSSQQPGTPSNSQQASSSRLPPPSFGTPTGPSRLSALPGTPSSSSQASALDASLTLTPSRRRPIPRASVSPRKRAFATEPEAPPAAAPAQPPAAGPSGGKAATPKPTPTSKAKKLAKQQKLTHWFSPSSSSNAGSSQ